MKRNKKKLIELSKNYLEYIEILLPELEKEILLRIIDNDKCVVYQIPFNKGTLFVDLFNTSTYKINVPNQPFYTSDRISLDIIGAIGMPSFSTVTASRCRSEEDYFIKSILTEILSNVVIGRDLVSILREISNYCEISSYFIPQAEFDNVKVEIVSICSESIGYKNEDLSSEKRFKIYYKTDGDKNMKLIVIRDFNSIKFANTLIL